MSPRSVSSRTHPRFVSQLHHALKVLNNYFLGSTEFINSTEVSIADLAAYCELTQNRVIGLDLSQHPKVAAWMQRVEQVRGGSTRRGA